jgi:integrase
MEDFWAFLQETPEDKRHGPVLNPRMPSGGRATSHQACRMVSLIGELAGVVVDRDPVTNKVTKYASAHDLRRSCGTRWSSVLSQSELKDMMRHADYRMTDQFYVNQNAVELAKTLWRKAGAQKLPFHVLSSKKKTSG